MYRTLLVLKIVAIKYKMPSMGGGKIRPAQDPWQEFLKDIYEVIDMES